ncbi:MAG: hypothetical protein AUK35_05760 [Zetaproteobacteria bacterium CG2_30_46_52]|nr:MAG: hypothetical protein AUK35_05760 [Zetaproteobacteria bacterium CG2_30_46_52]
MNDVMINKIQSIHRCIKRAKEEFEEAGSGFAQNFSRQDASILNITRACEQAIDLANVVIKEEKLGIPSGSRDAFELLAKNNLIPQALSTKMQHMVGFRNTVIHEYQQVNIAIVQAVLETGLNDLLLFTDAVIEQQNARNKTRTSRQNFQALSFKFTLST